MSSTLALLAATSLHGMICVPAEGCPSQDARAPLSAYRLPPTAYCLLVQVMAQQAAPDQAAPHLQHRRVRGYDVERGAGWRGGHGRVQRGERVADDRAGSDAVTRVLEPQRHVLGSGAGEGDAAHAAGDVFDR